MLTRALQRMLESDKLKRDHEDMGRELSANRREIGALQTGLSPIEERLAAELNASNRRAAALQAQLASITTSQADQVDLTASDARTRTSNAARSDDELRPTQGQGLDTGRRSHVHMCAVKSQLRSRSISKYVNIVCIIQVHNLQVC